MSVLLADPDSELDYAVDWKNDGYLQAGETIATSAWSITPADGVSLLPSANGALSDGVASISVAGIAAGKHYFLTNSVVTSAGRKDDRSITLLGQHL